MDRRASTPVRPNAAFASVRPARRWLPTGLVAMVIAVTVLGGFVTAETLPPTDVAPLSIGGVVTITPLPGWEVVRREAVTLPTPGGGGIETAFVQLTRGSGALDLLAIPGPAGETEALAAFYRDEVLEMQLDRLSVSDELRPVALPSGPGVQFSYIGTEPSSGAAIEGSVTIVVAASGNGAVFDGWGFEGQLQLIAEELAAMVSTAEVT